MPCSPIQPGRAGARRRGLALGLGLLLVLAGCTPPGPPAPGTPGIDLSRPLPFTPLAGATATLAPATPLPSTSQPPPLPSTQVPATPGRPSTATAGLTPVPTVDRALPLLVITNSQGSLVPLYVEIADTPAKQETGLMNRTAMAEDQGMLFVFQGETTVPFWMKDTLLPLSIAFIRADGAIVDLQDMQPLDLTLHNPAHPYTYALEVNQGYFLRHSIVVGNTVRVPALTPPTAPRVPDASP